RQDRVREPREDDDLEHPGQPGHRIAVLSSNANLVQHAGPTVRTNREGQVVDGNRAQEETDIGLPDLPPGVLARAVETAQDEEDDRERNAERDEGAPRQERPTDRGRLLVLNLRRPDARCGLLPDSRFLRGIDGIVPRAIGHRAGSEESDGFDAGSFTYEFRFTTANGSGDSARPAAVIMLSWRPRLKTFK